MRERRADAPAQADVPAYKTTARNDSASTIRTSIHSFREI